MPSKLNGKKLYRLGVWLLSIGVLLMVVGIVIGYRFLYDLPLPAFFDSLLEEARSTRLAGVFALCGPGGILCLIGYSLIEKFADHQFD